MASTENLPLGHNHANFLKAINDKKLDTLLINSALGAEQFASTAFANKV